MATTYVHSAQPKSAGAPKRYRHPFTQRIEDFDNYETVHEDPNDKDTPRTLVELRMCALSAAIREKSGWWVKFQDEQVRAKWAKEIKLQQRDLHPSLQLTANMINYTLGELQGYAALRDPETGIEPGPYERIWKSDHLIPPSLRAELLAAVAPLESVPEAAKDWHPGSNDKVLDLVHPSLYPVVYGRTIDRLSREPLRPRPSDVPDMFKSERFQWLPSDFYVQNDGTVKLMSPYINNIHPEDHVSLVNVILRVLARAVPMFERVLSDLARERQLPSRLDLKGEKFPQCIWPDASEPYPEGEDRKRYLAEHERLQAEDRERYFTVRDKFMDAEFDAWAAKGGTEDDFDEPPYPELEEVNYYQQFVDEHLDKVGTQIWPDSKPDYNGGLNEVKKAVDLREKTLQVIVKLANIVLTPEKPEYGGGTWHVEGMDNEAIVSTFIYYYDTENTTESTLSFRNAVNEPRYHEQYDAYCMYRLYGIRKDDMCVQDIGKVITQQGRCIAFPNIYQHLVSPFCLEDVTKPGHRKILVFFLVDPNIIVPSATTVAPQQEGWIRRAVDGTALWQRLPIELQEYIWEWLDPISDEQAKQYREQLMEERTLNRETINAERFGTMFNLCEH